MNKIFKSSILVKYLLTQIIVLYVKISQNTKLEGFISYFIAFTEEDYLFRIEKIKNKKKYKEIKATSLYNSQPGFQRKPIHRKYITNHWKRKLFCHSLCKKNAKATPILRNIISSQ